jgi:branched-chain amino acid transport system permease protein
MEYIVVSILNGVVHGLLLFMVSAGLTLIFGMMGVLNFAHAWFYMLGAYVGFTLTRLGGFWIGLVLAPIVAGFSGVLVERYLLRRVHQYGHAHELLLTFGLAFIIEEVIKLFYGDALVSYQMPEYMRFAAFTIFETNYPFYRLFMGAVALGMFVILYLLLTRTRVGIIVRAATYRPSTVEALGHNLPLVFMGVFAGGSALAGLAGAVAGAFYPTGPNMAVDFGTLVFVVVVVGGLGSVVGALIASLMIGLFISFSVGLNISIADFLGLFGLGEWASEVGGLFTLQLSTIANSMPFLLMLLVLLIRPAGLMGDRQ